MRENVSYNIEKVTDYLIHYLHYAPDFVSRSTEKRNKQVMDALEL